MLQNKKHTFILEPAKRTEKSHVKADIKNTAAVCLSDLQLTMIRSFFFKENFYRNLPKTGEKHNCDVQIPICVYKK